MVVPPAVAVVVYPVVPHDGVCQVAVVELVAVNTCPFDGAVAALTETVVVALFSPYAIASVQFDRLPLVGVPSTGAIRACPLGNTTVPVNVGDAEGAFVFICV